jgi:hypothetical protein
MTAMVTPYQVEPVSLRVSSRELDQRILRRTLQTGRQLFHNLPDDFILHRKDVALCPIVLLGPELTTIGSLHQLQGDAHSPAGFAYRTLQDGVDLQPARHLAHIDSLSLELKDRRSGDHPQSIETGKRVDEFVGEAVGKIVLFAARTQ